jgi:hypothetical protein
MKNIILRLEQLINEGNQIRELFRGGSYKPDVEREERAIKRNTWLLSSINILDKVGLKKFLEEFEKIENGTNYEAFKMAELVGILQSALNEIKLGFIFKIQHILHADMFSSLLEQARSLLESGHKIPSGVLARIVIEKWLFDFAEQNGLKNLNLDKASAVNDSLKENGIFSIPKWRQVQSNLDIGNAAAHGKSDQFDVSDVKIMFQFIENNCF